MNPGRRNSRSEASDLNERGRKLDAEGNHAGAIVAYRAAVEVDPSWSVPWYNLGLVYKYQEDWKESAACNLRAVTLTESDGDAWWNLGIAATAVGDWAQARDAWTRCGISIPAGEGPIQANFGLTPVRLDPGGRGEVVWCDRIDPARAVIRNIPLPGSGRRYGDILLHDGAPNGTRMLGEQEVPVFDMLALLEGSQFRTWILDLPGSTDEVRGLLSDVAFEFGCAAEDWSRSISYLCRACSEGRPHGHHDDDLKGSRPGLAVAAAARSETELEELLDLWRRRGGFDGFVGYVVIDEEP